MLKRNSFFMKFLVPVITVMLLQLFIIGAVLVATGTIDSLEDAEVQKLAVNAETRGATLEQMMVHYWSNLNRLELNITELIDAYLADNDITIEQALGSYTHETNMLDAMSYPLIDALRTSASTGIFMLFLDKEGFQEIPQARNGLYYRDLNPLSNPTDNSDLIFLKGYIDIARKDRIQLDSLWSEEFLFDPAYPGHWQGFANPQIAAIQYPDVSSVDLAYWNGPHLQNPHTQYDTNPCITYTRPLLYNGIPIALIGTEVQLVQLERYFPATDFDANNRSGYMLMSIDSGQSNKHTGKIMFVNGSYIKRLIGTAEEIHLTLTEREGIYSATPDAGGEGVQAALRTLRLYNSNAPFSGEIWTLAALGSDEVLFSTSRSLSFGLIISFVLSFVLGSLLLAYIVRRATRPLISIAGQIEQSSFEDDEENVFTSDSDIYELSLLCTTLNMMSIRRSQAESLVREERRRYLIALESATNTFMEYDVPKDTFMLYYFTPGAGNSLASKSIDNFSSVVENGQFCHPDDIPVLMGFAQSNDTIAIEIRAKASVFSHITETMPDGEYFWFDIKASLIYDASGNVSKIIGTATEKTKQKLEEIAAREAVRRDPVTKAYNRDFGLNAVHREINFVTEENIPYSLYIVKATGFDNLESFYGRVFSAFVLMEISSTIFPLISDSDIVVRLSNDEFLFFFNEEDTGEIKGAEQTDKKLAHIENAVETVYAGEKTKMMLIAKTEKIDTLDNVRNQNRLSNPVSIAIDISRENISNAVFDLFEHTSDINSCIQLLLRFLGRMFGFSHIIVCGFDPGFNANHISHHWLKNVNIPLSSIIDKIPHADASAFESLLDENGAYFYTAADVSGFSPGIKKLLCVSDELGIYKSMKNAYCCVMYENAENIGRIIFMSDDSGKTLSENDKHDLCGIVKIAAAHISIDKSRSASRAKSEFLSRVSHEIRTPMNAIIGMTDIAKSAVNDPERLRESLNQIDFSAKHLLTLINDVLEMSRIESGKLEIETKPFSLDDLVYGIETLMRVPIENKNITFKIVRDYTDRNVLGDEYRLRQVLVNLLGNANKFTGEGGSITLIIRQINLDDFTPPSEVKDKPGIYKFAVIDTGIGINAEDQPHVFEAFEQATEITAGHREGTGLGLAISGSIVTAMGGKIELDSKPGKGSDFHFTIRLALQEPDSMQGGGNDTADTEITDYSNFFIGKRALLVDDVYTNIAVATHALQETGIEIDVAKNGRQAVDMFKASSHGYYDIIFMDVKMPVMDGFTATKLIRTDLSRPDADVIPIVAMTANAYDEDLKKTIDSGMNGHITKPIEKDKLFKLMAQLLQDPASTG